MSRLAEAVEASTDVRKRGMMGFYSNLLTKNIALGGSLDSAVSAYTAGSSRNTNLLREEERPGLPQEDKEGYKDSAKPEEFQPDPPESHSSVDRKPESLETTNEFDGVSKADTSTVTAQVRSLPFSLF